MKGSPPTTDLAGSDAPLVVLHCQQVWRQPGDGSCLFHSLAKFTTPTSTAARERVRLMRHLVQPPDMRVAGNPGSDWVRYDSGLTLAQYTNSMATAGWGGGLELITFAHAEARPVQVFERILGRPGSYRCIAEFRAPHVGAASPCTLVYQGRMHYDVLLPDEA